MRSFVVVVVGLTLSGCWSDWGRLFDTTVSSEHRVEDLRVLAIVADPPAFLADAAGNFGDVVVDPFVVDPRGGAVHLTLRLCRRDTRQPTCDGPAVTLFDQELTADPAVSLGVVDGSRVVVSLDPATLAALELGPLSTVPQQLDVVVDVSKPGASPPERESASLTLPLRIDPRAALVVNDGDGARVCGVDEVDVGCSDGVVGTCGDGVIDEFESCDPPDGETCDGRCQRFDDEFDACFAPPPACLVVEEPNLRPRIVGFRTNVDDEFAMATDGVEFDLGATISVGGSALDLQPVVDEVGALDVRQPFTPIGFFGAECAPGLVAGCARQEATFARFYIRDGPLEIKNPFNGGSSAATIEVGAGAEDQDVVVVVADDSGGFDVATVRLTFD